MDANEYYCGSCLSGSQKAYNARPNKHSLFAWFDDNSSSRTHAVKGKKANALGLFDMSGNVSEWAFEWRTAGSHRVFRGGYYNLAPTYQQIGFPWSGYPATKGSGLGFRLAKH